MNDIKVGDEIKIAETVGTVVEIVVEGGTTFYGVEAYGFTRWIPSAYIEEASRWQNMR